MRSSMTRQRFRCNCAQYCSGRNWVIHNIMPSKDRVPIKNREKNLVHTMPSKDLEPMEDIQHGMPSMNREKNIQNQKTCTTMPVWMRTSEAMKFENFISFYRTIPV